MIGSFVDEGEPMLHLLRKRVRDTPDLAGIQQTILDRLLAAFEEQWIPASEDQSRTARDLLRYREIERSRYWDISLMAYRRLSSRCPRGQTQVPVA
ncbi:hypothetical protein [Burkholderia cepacia]|uniref:hypothetical protein n=1 Tax=Burkholderia cepacia TaxID=292 RepID=UPI003EE181C8